MWKRILALSLCLILIITPMCYGAVYNLRYTDIQEGRLFVAEAEIDVGFVYTYLQGYTDMEDIATEFNMLEHDMWVNCEYFADHSTQEFSKLKDVEIGDIALVDYRYKNDVWLECVEITHGHNCKSYFADENWCIITETPHNATYLMYTCEDCWQNILMTWWIEVDFND